jgi:hypothetical protein
MARLDGTKTKYRALLATIRNVEDALDRKLKLEKALLNICLRFPRANLRNVVKEILEGELPIVGGQELHYDLARPLGVALEDYDDPTARKADLAELFKRWTSVHRKKALAQKPVGIPV